MASCMFCPVRIAASRKRRQSPHMAGHRGVCPVCRQVLLDRIKAGTLTEAEAVANSWILPDAAARRARLAWGHMPI